MLVRIADMLGCANGEMVNTNRESIAELRLRTGRPMQINRIDGTEITGEIIEGSVLQSIINYLMDYSMYSREKELQQGYFTTSCGFRVGVCGKVNPGDRGIEQLANIGSICIRVPREVKGCANEIYLESTKSNSYSLLIASPPGLGKTTLLRDYIRSISCAGMNVALADERREIACCMDGIPQLDVGERTDVMDGCPKHIALGMMIRSCAPDLVAVDEIGSCEDAQALLDAHRCGVYVAATMHAGNLKEVLSRRCTQRLIEENIFDRCVFLGPRRGQIRRIISLRKDSDERGYDVQGFDAGVDPPGLCLRWEDAFKRSQKKI